MIISDTKKFIFLHNPKVAGTSIRNAIRIQYDTRDNFFWGPFHGGSLNRRVDKAHMALDDLKVLFPGDYKLFKKYFVFCFVRNPYERYVSSFAEYLKHYQKEIKLASIERQQFLNLIEDFSLSEINQERIRYDFLLRHFIPQYSVIFSGIKCKADYVGRIENIDQDIKKIKKILNLDDFVRLGESNKQTRKLGELYNELPIRVRDIIKRLYEKDFMYFNYDE